MRKFKHYTAASLGLILFITVIGLSVPQSGHGTTAALALDVRVVNTDTQAVPVDVQGAVKAKQQGEWNVGIEGTPTVHVTNSTFGPILTRDADRPTAQPFKAELTLIIPDGNGAENAFVTIPVGKVLVVEHVSAFGSVPPDQEMDGFSVLTRTAPDNVQRPHYFNDVKREFQSATTHTVSESVRIYAEGNLGVRAGRRTPTGSVTFRYTISGYLVDK
jgi:hypothetical protein